MDNGTIWGHGAYLGPDFGAAVLHDWAIDLAGRTAHSRFSRAYADLSAGERAGVDGEVGALLKTNRYDPSFNKEIEVWKKYFEHPVNNGGLPVRAVNDPQELHDLTAFFLGSLEFGGAAPRHRQFLYEQLPL